MSVVAVDSLDQKYTHSSTQAVNRKRNQTGEGSGRKLGFQVEQNSRARIVAQWQQKDWQRRTRAVDRQDSGHSFASMLEK